MNLTPEQKRERFTELAHRDDVCTAQELAKASEDQGQLLLFDAKGRPRGLHKKRTAKNVTKIRKRRP